mgnify:CR=1 FL=1
MLSRITTIAIVAVMALLLSGVAIAQIGVFESPQVEESPDATVAATTTLPDDDTADDDGVSDGAEPAMTRDAMPDDSDESGDDTTSTTMPDDDDDADSDETDTEDSDTTSTTMPDDDDDADSDETDAADSDTTSTTMPDDDDDADSDEADSDEADSDEADSDESDDQIIAPVLGESVEYQAAGAGFVWITFDGYYLTLDEIVLNDGWYVTKQDVTGDQIELEFHSCDTKVEFKAETDDGKVKLEVKSSPDNDDVYSKHDTRMH